MTRKQRTIGVAAILLVLAGCKSTSPKSTGRNDDPLLGGNYPPPMAPQAVSQPPAGFSPAPNTPNYPPLTTATPTSTAALASGAYPPLMGGQDLRIGTPPAGGVSGNRIQPPSQNPPGVVAVITADDNRNTPTPPPGVVPLGPNGVRPIGSTPTSGGGSLEQGLAELAQFNPKWHRLENTGPGTWRFMGSIPDRSDPSKGRTYEVEGPTASAALQSALERIRAER